MECKICKKKVEQSSGDAFMAPKPTSSDDVRCKEHRYK